MRIRGIAIVAVTLLVATFAAACGGGDAGDKKSSSKRIGISFYTKTIPLYSLMEDGIKEEAKKLGVDVEFSYANNSAETQSNQINTFVTKDFDAIIASPIDVDALVPAYQQARDAGVPVLSVANKLSSEKDEDLFIGPDLVKMAEETMDAISDAIGGSGDLLYLSGPPQIAFVQNQQEGIDAFLAKNKGVKLAKTVVVPDMTTGKATDVASSAFAGDRTYDAVFSSLDDVSLGAIEAAKSANRDIDKIFFAGWDGSPAGVQAVRDGDYDLTVSLKAKTWGGIALKTAVDFLDGKKPEGHNVRTPYLFINADNIQGLTDAKIN